MAWNLFKKKEKSYSELHDVYTKEEAVGVSDSSDGSKKPIIHNDSRGSYVSVFDYMRIETENSELRLKILELENKANSSQNAKPVLKDNSVEEKVKAVKNHLLTVGNITSLEAIKLFGYTRLSGGIFKLKQEGMNIRTTKEQMGKSNFVRYHLVKND